MKTKPLRIMQKHKYLAIAISIVVGGLWIALVMYTFSLGKTKVPVNPGVAAVSSAHQSFGTNMPTPSFKTMSSAPWSLTNHSAVVTPEATARPQATMGSTSMRIHETSSATVHVVGSGTGNAGQGVIATTSGINKGISYSGISAGGNMLAISSSLALADPGATHANEIASTTTSGPSAAPEARRVNGNPHGPFPDPLGDVAWGLIILLAAAYATMRGVRRARREEK